MRFAKRLAAELQQPEFAEHYIPYKALKKLIKRALIQEGAAELEALHAISVEFVNLLEQHVQDVHTFFEGRLAALSLRTSAARTSVEKSFPKHNSGLPLTSKSSERPVPVALDERTIDELVALDADLAALGQFAMVNREAVRKISKKIIKNVATFAFVERLAAILEGFRPVHSHSQFAQDVQDVASLISQVRMHSAEVSLAAAPSLAPLA